MKRHARMIPILLLLAGCDQISERAGFPDPAKMEADGKAIGGACRHAGRGLEDCYRLNKAASKAAIYAGWKEMNEYMAKNNMQEVEPTISPLAQEAAKMKESSGHGEKDAGKEGDKKADKKGEKKSEAPAKESASH